ncbi:hypothetical protein TcarDRAFT_2733 [Thermosinus carboxydivorans Nor1]|uniref:Uncharacterized protein n=1 Tax=Thermosinus carboxydivorans Nor1 TaxID=401526 RepID=A1HM95_9FIRM|nr:hypothetical protein TcarDRAFT_2733 [Thermosinus carboxydivorans Nor1]
MKSRSLRSPRLNNYFHVFVVPIIGMIIFASFVVLHFSGVDGSVYAVFFGVRGYRKFWGGRKRTFFPEFLFINTNFGNKCS